MGVFTSTARIFCVCLLFLVFFAGANQALQAQVYPVQKFTEEDGLCHSNVYRIFQDKKGFMWFGTEYGVSRYDGNKFVNYLSTDAISLSTVVGIDDLGNDKKVIFTYRGGVTLLDHDSLQKVKIKNVESVISIIHGLIVNKQLWVINKVGSLYILKNNMLEEQYVNGDKNGKRFFMRMVKTPAEDVYLASSSGIYLYHGGVLKPFMENDIHEKVYTLCYDKSGSLWVGMQDKVLQIKGQTILNTYAIGHLPEISDMLVDCKGRVWVAAPKVGVLLLENGRFINVTDRLKLQNILINALFEDKDANIWIATHGSGLYCVTSTNLITFPVQAGTINNYTNSITSNGKEVYLATIGTLSKYVNHKMLPVKIDHINPNDYIYFVEKDNGKLYIGTQEGIIIKYPGLDGAEKFLYTAGGISYFKDRAGKIWIGKFGSVGYLENDEYISVASTPEFSNNKRVNCITGDHNGNILFGTDSGIVVFDHAKYSYLMAGSTYFSNRINAILEDSRHRLWIATEWGIAVYENGNKHYFTTKNGLSGNRCTSLAEDVSGNIWIGTLTGLNRYDGKQFIKLDSRSGLSSNAILSLCIDDEQNIWIGTVNGVSLMSHEQIDHDIIFPDIYITTATLRGKNYFFPTDITVLPGDRSLHISYAGLVFPRSDKVEYQYKIEPLNKEWLQTSGNEIELSALSPGDYTLYLRARHIGYAWNKTPAVLHVRVRAPFWQNTWFIILLSAVALFLTYRGLRWWIMKKEREKREKTVLSNKMVYLKQQALNSMINPHFVFNCLNAIQSYIYSNNKEHANRFLVKFSKLIRMTLEHGQDAFISLEKELERIELYLSIEQLRFENKLSFEIEIHPSVNVDEAVIPNMVLQPYIENAIKHGIMPKKEGGLISVNIKMVSDDEIEVIIEDNGIGIQKSTDKKLEKNDLHHSLGMKLTDERLRLLSKMDNKIYEVKISQVLDANGVSGTRVVLLIAFNTRSKEMEEMQAEME